MPMTPKEFVAKWSKIQLKEITTAQSHFLDICQLVGHPAPLDADPVGEFFTFEAVTDKVGGKRGRADVWYKSRFIWEYKGADHDLDKAYEQLLLYRESLGNPPLLITSDTHKIIIHTNFTNTVKEVHEIEFDRLATGDGLALLRRVFYEPESFRPTQTQEQVTKATADTFVEVANTLQKWAGDTADSERLAHFIIRLLFCLFSEDMGLLPDNVFSQLVRYQGRQHFSQFTASLRTLFTAMRDGGQFGITPIPHFDGGLFDDDFVPDLPSDIIDKLIKTAVQDWSAIDPTIFGTLFERIIDPAKRAQLGAHYTDKSDIMLIVEPVLMKPLRDKWQTIKQQATRLLHQEKQEEAAALLQGFANEVAAIRVLDPAGGSGNFLYVSLRQLLDLQKEIIAFAGRHGLPPIPLTVSPHQLYGIEINPYAHELAQITVWIGYIQWRFENGFPEIAEPILQPLRNIERKDAILAYDENGRPVEPTWPEVDVIMGNPPFLGDKRMRTELSDQYVDMLRGLYEGRVLGGCDLVCYWFEKANKQISLSQTKRVGLLATNSIRDGANRKILERIKENGDIFAAWSNLPWVLDGASVRVSIVAFDNGQESIKWLDGKPVGKINANLTSETDLTKALSLSENQNLAFIGTQKSGDFELTNDQAKKFLSDTNNPHTKLNSDVIRPWMNAIDVTQRNRNMWIIFFGDDTSADEASTYVEPFNYLKQNVMLERLKKRPSSLAEKWWLLARTRPAMWKAIGEANKYIVTPRVAKHRTFTFVESKVVPDTRLVVIARSDFYFFGILHSRIHETWALSTSPRHGVGNDPTYNAMSCFETFPFPWPPSQEPAEADNEHVAAIAQAARELDQFRTAWLNPPPEDIGIVVPERLIKQLTLTNLYNALTLYRDEYKGKVRDRSRWQTAVKGIITLEQIEELDYIHGQLDTAVLAAYGWPPNLTDEHILERLLALNLERAAVHNEG